MKSLLVAVLSAAALAACGGGGGGDGPSPSVATNTVESGNTVPAAPAASNPASGNAFLALVRNLISTTPDDQEPVAIGTSDTQTTDNAEAAPVS